ncbi:MAG: AraC family transcriptional regulator [Ruminococcaceae bacterium]|nr:AraC family transcriptional regulator [Oscillospiraceae bacterium]
MKSYQEELKPILKTYKARFSQCYSRVATHFVSAHWHNAYEILYVRRGYGKQQLNAEIADIRPGDIVIICPGDVHATEAISNDGCDIDYVQFSVDLIYNTPKTLQTLHSGIVHADDESIKKLFDALLQNNHQDYNGKELITTGLIYTLCGFLVRMSFKEVPTKHSKMIEKVCAYIMEETDIRLEKVSAHFYYSPEHLSRKFHKEIGISYRDWCKRIIMDRAINLMKDEDNTIEFIAETLGYSDKSSFIRSFKRMFGITPNAYRSCENNVDSPV